MKKLSLKILGMIIIGIVVLQGTVFATSNINQLNNKKEQNQDKIDETKEKKDDSNFYCAFLHSAKYIFVLENKGLGTGIFSETQR